MIDRARMRRVLSGVLLPALLACLASCAYYNTFYLAKRDFRLAEDSVSKSTTDKLPSDAANNYQIAIRQSKKVLVNHSKSRWVDDSIYLMAASYYGMGVYDSSLLSVGLLMSRFPKSEFRADALFLSGMCYTKQHEDVKAAALFDSVLTQYPRYEKKDQIIYTMAGTAVARRDRASAIRGYTKLARDFPKSRYASDALHRAGELYFEAGRYDSASAAYGALLAASKETKDRIDAGVLQSQALIRLGRAEEALALLRELEPPEAATSLVSQDPASFAAGERAAGQTAGQPVTNQPVAGQPVPAELGDQIARLQLGEAAALNKLERHVEAQSLLREIVRRFGQSSYAVEAQFQLGYTYETLMDSLDAAQSAYDKVALLAGRSVFKDQAAQRSKALQSQIELEKTAGAGDAEAEQRAAAALRVAEILLLDRELVDPAIARYQEVEKEYPESRSAPRAAYALAYIRWKNQGDSLGAQEQLRDLVGRYPSSVQARGAISLLVSQGADTAGLGGLLRAVEPESTATAADSLRFRADSLAAPADTTQPGLPLPGAGPQPLDIQRGGRGAPGDTSDVRRAGEAGPQRRNRRATAAPPAPEEQMGPPAPTLEPEERSGDQLPLPPARRRAAEEQMGPPAPAPEPEERSGDQLPLPPARRRAAEEQMGPPEPTPPPAEQPDGQLPPPPAKRPPLEEQMGPPAPEQPPAEEPDGQLPPPPAGKHAVQK